MITLLSTPRKYQPAYGNTVLQFTSTAQTAYYKYRYVVDIYADNEFISRLKITPQNNDWGQCDISDIMKNYTNSNPVNMGCDDNTPINICKWGWLDEDIIDFRVFVGEEYATTENGDTLIYDGKGNVGDPAVSWGTSKKYLFNGVKEWFDGKYFDSSVFYLNTSLPTTPEPWDTHRYLTNAPRVQYIQDNEYATLSALNTILLADRTISEGGNTYSSEPIFSARFEFYDVNDGLVSSARTYNIIDNCGWRLNCSGATGTIPIFVDYSKKYISYLGTGTANLDSHGISYPSSTKYYRVCLEKAIPPPQATPTPTPSMTPTPSATPPTCDCRVYEIYNPYEYAVTITYEPCPGGSTSAFTASSVSYSTLESCSTPPPVLGDVTITEIGSCVCNPPSPSPTPSPTSSPAPEGDRFIALNRCDDETYAHFDNTTGTTIGQFFCYNNEVYEIISLGGGGFISSNITTFYSGYSEAFAVCPCGGETPGDENCLQAEQISEWFYYYFADECSSTNIRIMFENKLGTYDYYTFKGAEDVGYDVNRQIYTEAPGLYVDGWDENTYYGWKYTNKVWNNPQSKTGILRSGYISKADAIWLSEELSRSPRVYIIYDDGDIEPIIPTNTEVVIPNPKRPGQIELILEYSGGYKELRQNN
jgi:hypothetical protein